MARLRMRMSMSLDGFVAGPDQSVENPLGVGGMRLHEWAFHLKAFREMHGMGDGGDVNESTPIVAGMFDGIGATVMGRNMFGGHPGPWKKDPPWDGWWGRNPPYHHPVFVITHHARPPLELEGGNLFHFVTEGPEAALKQAIAAAKGKDVSLGGGAQTVRAFLARGLVDEMTISLVPILLARGERIFEGLGTDLHGLTLARTLAAPDVTHLVLARSR